MTDLSPEKRTELRAAVEERHLFRFATERGSDGYPSSGLLEISREVLALLDAADERDRLAAALRQIAKACHWSHDPSSDPEALIAYIGQLQSSADDALDTVERVRELHERDELGFCVACDYMTPHPCPTRRTMDGTDG